MQIVLINIYALERNDDFRFFQVIQTAEFFDCCTVFFGNTVNSVVFFDDMYPAVRSTVVFNFIWSFIRKGFFNLVRVMMKTSLVNPRSVNSTVVLYFIIGEEKGNFPCRALRRI